MKLTAKGRYAVMAVADMAAQTDSVQPFDVHTAPIIPLRDISTRQGISIQFLEQLFGKLRKAGLVESVRGVKGGYKLSHDPRHMRLSAIISAVNEDIKAHGCTPETKKACNGLTSRCLTHNLWGALEAHIGNFLEHVSVQDVVDDTVHLPELALEAAQ
ncbi:Rrf2 family transcriptional regulator [Fretibacter rubidus]|uniref:Rrf2 family transcriptional regulator n=1 Tax=Fretibacter rubidus TaxID=570162 RepID=UPI00352B50C5